MKPEPTITIRNGRPADAEIVAAFNLALARETENLALDPQTVLNGVQKALADAGKGTYFIAEIGGEIVGCLMITHEWSDWRDGDMWWIQSVYVREDARRLGVFRKMFDHVRQAAVAANVRCIRLYVEHNNHRAKKTYASLGMNDTHYDVMELPLTGAE